MSDRNGFALLVIALSIAFAPAVNGEPAPAPPDRSLAAALAAARPPETGVAISVDAGNVPLTERVKFPAPGLPIGAIADAYGRLVRPFGSVQAVAPPTMTILNTNPAAPNLYQDMPPTDVLRLLALSLNAEQWGQLTGPQGLGMDDLDDKQQVMFAALFPGESLQILPRDNQGSAPIQTISADRLLQSRLFLFQKVQIMLPVVGDGMAAYMGPSMPPNPGDPQVYTVMLSAPRTVGGISMKAEVPNVPKRSNLDYSSPLFRTPISLSGLKTVGDLVARIAHQTQTELYADSRLEILPLSIVGEDHAAPADLLPALAFCVTGTFRNVGPAFVLTDDLIGLGTRRAILEAFFDSVREQQQALLKTGGSLALVHPIADLPLSNNSLAITPVELKQSTSDTHKVMGAGVTVDVDFEQLTREQQTAVQSMFNTWEAAQQAREKEGYFVHNPSAEQHLSLDGKIELSTMPILHLRVPGLDGVVDMESKMNVDQLFMTPLPTGRRSTSGVPAPLPPALEILKRYGRRAIMARPRTLQELDAVIAAMPAADLNELWLIVPDPGEPVFAGKSALSTPDAGALIEEALKKAGPAHIGVNPVLSLFNWGADAPAADLDYTIRGETSAQRWARKAMEFERLHTGAVDPSVIHREMVSPFAPSVATALDALLKAVIRPGIAGMAWQAPSVPGYEPPEDPPGSGSSNTVHFIIHFVAGNEPDFGYTVDGRLRFLREEHTDPIDLTSARYGRLDLSLPTMDEGERGAMLQREWDNLRASVDLKVVQQIFSTAQRLAAANTPPGAPFAGLPVLMPTEPNEYGSWEDQRVLPVPMEHPVSGTPEDIAARARRSSHIVMGEVAGRVVKDPGRLASTLLHSLGASEWDGVVFDLTPTVALPDAPAQSSLDLLTQLTASLVGHRPAP